MTSCIHCGHAEKYHKRTMYKSSICEKCVADETHNPYHFYGKMDTNGNIYKRVRA